MEILFILVLIVINAFFAASEMAIVSINKAKLSHMAEEEDNEKAKLLLGLLEETSKFLATIQVGITLAGFLASASAATSLSQPLAKLLRDMNVPWSNQLSLIIVTIILSYVTLVFGELLPKRLALQHAERIALFVIKPILLFSKITIPFVKILTWSTNLLMRLFGINTDKIEEDISEEEIKMMIEVGEETGVINQTEREMIDSIFDFDDTLAKEIMTPRNHVFAIDINTPLNELIDEILEEKYSRIPVYEEDIDNIVGVLYGKDLYRFIRHDSLTEEKFKELIRPAYFVPETKTIDTLFKELQLSKNYIAILIDEYGGFSGIVTMEDLLEEIVGNIFDEYDEISEYIKKIDTNTYIVDGMLSIDEINEMLHINLPDDHTDTIGGFVINLLGSIPKEDEEESVIEYNNIVFKVEEFKDKRIQKLKIHKP
ncbi:hemolysin family protein [Clostridium sp. MSJ-11]|uniref:Hemolysin family protein n=1 Tax=Clostridium mobile TaxID=2841512 RepID=A0ABS6EDY0_9CLOT|nr:hemolysin family protein [Clostridium mobile]MBU5483408.1 hemolysin family protein [Clostridium mobile]